MKLGEIIKVFRNKNKMTMQEFATMAGLSKGYISMLERNQHPQSQRKLVPSFDTYLKVASAMGMSIDDLVAILDDNEMTRLNSNPAAPAALAEDEQELIFLYKELNEEGQEKLLEYADDLVASGKYIKNGSLGMVEA